MDPFQEFGGAAVADPFAEFGGQASGDPFAEFGGTTEKEIVNAQHPQLGTLNRLGIKNLASSPEAADKALQGLGFETDRGPEGEVILRRPGEQRWHRIEKHGFELADIGDIVTDITGGLAMAGGAALGGGTTFGAATVAGAAGGAAAHEGAKRTLANLLGLGEGSLGKEAAGVAEEAVYGGLGEVTFGLGGKVLKPAAKAVGRAVGIGGKKAAEAVGKTAGAVKKAVMPAAKTLAPEAQAAARPAVSTAGKLGQEAMYETAERQIREAAARPVLSDLGTPLPKLSAESATKKWQNAKYLWERAHPGEELPRFVREQRGRAPKYTFTMRPQKMQELIGRMDDNTLRQWLHNAGHKGVWDVTQRNGREAYKVSREQMEKWAAKRGYRIEDAMVNHRASVWNEISKAQKAGEAFEAHFFERNGAVRRMVATANAPASASAIPRQLIEEWAASANDIGAVRRVARQLWQKGKPKGRARLSRIDDMGFDELVQEIWQSQKTAFTTGLKYNPREFGIRTVWDMEKRMWRSMPMDPILRLRRAGGEVIDYMRKSPQTKGLQRAVGSLFRGVGETIARPGEALSKKIAATAGIRKFQKFLAPGVAAYGTFGPTVQALGAATLAGRGLSTVGKLLLRSPQGVFNEITAAAPPGVRHLLRRISIIRHLKGPEAARAALYTLARNNQALADWLAESEEDMYAVQE